MIVRPLNNVPSLVLAVSLAFAALGVSSASAQTYSDIHDFAAATLSSPLYTGILAQGRDGNLYGTAPSGGTLGFGGVFKITPTGAYSVIYNFDGTAHGKTPRSGLTLGTDGSFYGTTWQGGVSNYGTIFKITSTGTLTVLHNFSYSDGGNPYSLPIQGSDGNFYGATEAGGTGAGTVYKITSSGTFTSLHSFSFSECATPVAPLIQGTDGNFYGVCESGGVAGGDGSVIKITSAGVVTVMYSFDFTHGSHPNGPLVEGTDGNFYGTTSGGGSLDGGVVFKLTPAKVLAVLYNFNAKPGSVDGSVVDAGVIQATDGNFYGVTDAGGTNGFGTVYKVTSTGVYSVLYNLMKTTGSVPETTARQHTSGKFYGETNSGGANSLGALFSFDVGLKPFVGVLPASGKVAKPIGILGSGFTGATSVKFNVTSATFSVVSDTYISATVPSGAGTSFVSVVTPGGTLKSNLKFRVTPTVTSFSPTSGTVGTQVTITGTGLTQASNVKFGGAKLAVFTVNSDIQITATVPAGAVTGKIQVTTAGGTATSSAVFKVN
jgi:uncharacterized repeat protein (TIGR03803 family)